jgi:hypothetical protein
VKTRKTITLILISMMLLISLGCQRSTERLIIGTWEHEISGMTIQLTFNSDGTVRSMSGGRSLEGTFDVNHDNLLTMNFDGYPDTVPIEFRGRDALLFINYDGRITTLRRIR